MTLSLVFDAPGLSAAACETFRRDTRSVFALYAAWRHAFRLPASRLTLVLADDFERAVRTHMRALDRTSEGEFSAERLGGVCAAKNLAQSDAYEDVVIVFDAAYWHGVEDSYRRVMTLHLIAHELAHPVIERVQHLSGVMNDVPAASVTPREFARSMARIMSGEYRADRMAGLVLGQFVSVTTPGGQSSKATLWGIQGGATLEGLRKVLSVAHPGWADTVQSYREWAIPIEEMWRRIVTSVDQTLTGLIHAQAEADAAGLELDVLTTDELRDLPAVRLYIRDPWREFLASVRRQPILQSLVEARRFHSQVIEAGETAVFEIWRRLGLDPFERPDRTFGIWVREPLREPTVGAGAS